MGVNQNSARFNHISWFSKPNQKSYPWSHYIELIMQQPLVWKEGISSYAHLLEAICWALDCVDAPMPAGSYLLCVEWCGWHAGVVWLLSWGQGTGWHLCPPMGLVGGWKRSHSGAGFSGNPPEYREQGWWGWLMLFLRRHPTVLPTVLHTNSMEPGRCWQNLLLRQNNAYSFD